MQNILLDCSQTISRVTFQIDKEVSQKLNISNKNIVELLSYVGL